MDFPGLSGYLTGVAVPVTALRGSNDVGVGEFADLPGFGRLCRDAGLQVLQILPINDSGFDSSPYSALSAYALHPIYVRIDDLPEMSTPETAGAVAGDLKRLRDSAAESRTVAYHEVIESKLRILRGIYDTVRAEHDADSTLEDWIAQNDWVRPYCVFRVMKDRHGQAAWWQWGELESPDDTVIESFWNDAEILADLRFYAWIQLRLSQQLTEAVRLLNSLGVHLKGDLPILMNEDSTDVWLHRELFRRDLRAGAPPDMFSADGQNWGFPLYNWDRMEHNDYSWWRNRLRQADKYFHLFRIDHVLGFFRIWAVPERNESGALGFFRPSRFLSRTDLHSAGLDDGRIEWLAEPHLTRSQIEDAAGESTDELIDSCFDQIERQDLYRFSPRIQGDRDIHALKVAPDVKDALVRLYQDRALVYVSDELYSATWTFQQCSRYRQLPDDERTAFEALVDEHNGESERVWEEHGRRLLGFMRTTVGMLACAEDLGVVPECVPRVLHDLGILGLRVPRWTRAWDDPGEPFIDPREYPYLSVCAASVHDTSSLRGWWYEEPATRSAFWSVLGLGEVAPDEFTPEAAEAVFGRLVETNSALCMFQMQDLMSICGDLVPDDPNDERVNVPGTYNTENWSYRLPATIAELGEHPAFIDSVRKIADKRRR